MSLHFFHRALLAILAGGALFAVSGVRALAQGVGDSGCVDAPGYPCNIPRPQQVQTRPAAEIFAADRASGHFKNKEWAAAIEAYEEALRYCNFGCDYLRDNIVLASRNLANSEGNYWHKQDNFDLAIAAYQRALGFCRADMDCQYLHGNIERSRRAGMNQRGNNYHAMRNWGAAIAEYEAALDTCGYGDNCDYLWNNLTGALFSRALDRARRADTHEAEMAAYGDALNYCQVKDNCGWLRDQMRMSEEAYVLGNARRRTEARLSAARSLTYSDRPPDTDAYFDRLLQAENEIGSAISATRAVWGITIEIPYDDGARYYFFEECCRNDIRQEILSLVETLGELWHRHQYGPAREALDRIMRNWGGIDELGLPGSLMSAGAFLRDLQEIEERNREAWNREMVSDLSASGRSDIAINRIRAMLEDNPDGYSLWRQLANLEEEQGDWIAVAETRRVIVKLTGGGSSTALNNLGVAYSHLDRHQDAIDTYERALEVNPNNLYALSNLASNIVRHDPYSYDEAAELYARALATQPDPDDQEYYDEIKARAAKLEDMRGGIEHNVRRVLWPVFNSNTSHSLYSVVKTVGGAVSEGYDAVAGNDDAPVNLDQAKLASHYGGLAAAATNKISQRWQEFYLADHAGEAPHFLASQVFDRGQSGSTQIGGIDAVPDIEGGPVGGEAGALAAIPDDVAAALRNEPEWIEMAVQEGALEADLMSHVARLEALEIEVGTVAGAAPLEEITAQIEEVRQDIENTRDEREEVVKKMGGFAIDFSERRAASGTKAEKGADERESPAGGGRGGGI